MTNTSDRYYTPTDYGAAHYESTPQGASIPVVVVGAGPVGLATALGLAQRGVEVSVVDSGTSASYGSRATCYSRHTIEICDRLGYADAVEKRALGWVGGRSYYQSQEVLNFQMPQDEHNYRLPMFNLQQCEYEDIQIAKVLQEPNITMLWGSKLKGIETDEKGVTLTVDMADGERTLRADRVVASDGGRSIIRDLLGLTLKGTAYEGRYVIADIHWKSKLPTERRVWFDPPSNPGSTIIMHKQPDDIWRIDYQLLDDEDAEKETTREAIIDRITKHLSWLEDNGTITKEPWTLEWHSFYKALALALPSFVHGHDRVIFAGDAAHMVPIFGVRGLNSGMEDADTLAWMLAAVTYGDADPNLLHAYSQERHDAWEQNIANAGKSTLIMTPGTDGYRITRDALLQVSAVIPEFNHLINPRQSSATHALRSPLTVTTDVEGLQVGAPLDDRKITVDGKVTSIHTARGSAFGVYAVAPFDEKKVEAIAERFRKALPHEKTKVLPIIPGQDNGTAESWCAAPGEIVIVRPDGIVLSRGQPDEIAAVETWVKRGIAEAPRGGTPPAKDPILLSEDQVNREKVWLQLSEALDQTSDKYKFLTQLSIVLGALTGPEKVSEVIKQLNTSS
ncbi:hypothetical protein CspeluHIS016_0600880 [Cutaneotrichosporon spelunceum]|uniref:FAD-binding domain-containing protein n=1 Tax=Cutaneotrichosporon spelunceum TaxID=1672016 RepID=A0AAD3TXF3_9TREE|nr:hypothetical protein CspeluHIS016_0600880 [Cutaneotrichosporon spelunceum]